MFVVLQTLKDTMDSVTRLYNSSSCQKKEVVGKILETLLTKQYPQDVTISLSQLLKWDLWPTLIVVFSKCIIFITLCNHLHVCVQRVKE